MNLRIWDTYQTSLRYCTQCGSVLEEANFVNAVAFSAEGGMVGQMVTEGTTAFQSAVAVVSLFVRAERYLSIRCSYISHSLRHKVFFLAGTKIYLPSCKWQETLHVSPRYDRTVIIAYLSFSMERWTQDQLLEVPTFVELFDRAKFQVSLLFQDESGLYKNQAKGRIELSIIVDQLNIRPRDDTIESALRLYKLAVHRDFLRGRRVSTVCWLLLQ